MNYAISFLACSIFFFWRFDNIAISNKEINWKLLLKIIFAKLIIVILFYYLIDLYFPDYIPLYIAWITVLFSAHLGLFFWKCYKIRNTH